MFPVRSLTYRLRAKKKKKEGGEKVVGGMKGSFPIGAYII